MSCFTIPIGADCVIRLNDLTDNLTGLLVTDATAAGVLSIDGTNDYAFNFLADGTSGDYYAVIPASETVQLDHGTEYEIAVEASKGQSTHYVMLTATARVKEYN